ncbi:hypothetical protein ACIA8O_33670 [Kitasatospora sp. NPDC051853]|uniref:hypothetical protein n=1 Tax=Kitasatospora sp. NPDC051853 TaxID=3364058 RepID=UPI003797418B
MRNGLVQLGAWTAATGAAVALSWFGVHAVLAETAFEQPSALQLPTSAGLPSDEAPSTPPAATAGESSSSPSPTPSTVPLAPASPSPSRTPSKKPAAPSATPAAPGSPTAVSSVKSYRVPGGRVALDMQPTTAELVSATPDQDWQMQIWQGDKWLRVDFTKDGATNSVFATWNGHHPDVQTVVR